MNDAPLRANPEDRPLPPSGGNLPAPPSGGSSPVSPSGGNSPASPSDGGLPASPSGAVPATSPAADAAAAPGAEALGLAKLSVALEKAARRPAAAHIRPIGGLARPPRDWRRAWTGFLLGAAVLIVAIGLAWLLWDVAGAPRTARAPVEQLPPIDLAEMEALLDRLGFPPGEIDGVIDGDATVAIRDFQTTAGLPADGQPSAALLEELRAAHIELNGGQ